MAVLVGIDEAGYGPIIGPLVLSSCAISMPAELLDKDLWKVLRKSISRHKLRLAARLLVADSKKAFNREIGIKSLENLVFVLLPVAAIVFETYYIRQPLRQTIHQISSCGCHRKRLNFSSLASVEHFRE